MELKNRLTGKVIYSGDFKSMKELVLDAINEDISLGGAHLEGANLGGVDLRGANLRGANLRDAGLWGCAGNRREVRSMLISETYPITYTFEYLQIGCELHKISEWWSFDDDRIKEMDGKEALDFWSENKEFIKMAIEKYPATPTN